jgi:hypothetical protein
MTGMYRTVAQSRRLTFKVIAASVMWMIASGVLFSTISLCARAEKYFAPIVEASRFHSLCEICNRPATRKADAKPIGGAGGEGHLFCDEHYPKAGRSESLFGDTGAPIGKTRDPCSAFIAWLVACIVLNGLVVVLAVCPALFYILSSGRVLLFGMQVH